MYNSKINCTFAVQLIQENMRKIINLWKSLYLSTREDKKRLEYENKILKERIKELYNAYRRDIYQLKELYSQVVNYYQNK